MTALLALLALAALAPAARAAFDADRLAGLYTLRVGLDPAHNPTAPRCGDLLRFASSGTLIPAADISLDNRPCSGTTLNLVQDPQSCPGCPGFVRHFALDPRTGAFFVGAPASRLVCGAKTFGPTGSFFIFLRPDRDILVTWADVAGPNTPLQEASGSETYTFRAGVPYILLNNRCLFARDDSPPVRTGGAECLPAAARVALPGGRALPVARLRTGDRVHVGRGRYSPVFAWTHRDPAADAACVAIDAGLSRPLILTPGHFVYANGAAVPAGSVRPGDALRGADGRMLVVRGVQAVHAKGLYNPQTLQGDIVVEGVIVSTYTQMVERVQAHALLAPVRATFRCGVTGVGELLLRTLERTLFTWKL